ncbi:glycosyl hydrolase family 18 protein [Chitinophaga tropicalis]|uniref:Chitinase II/V-like catalytic domain-containing protein n=1 Tax=Chitinophaga tropicalis TaxID=2683588 RepID=A0A7K1U2I8_9BACT|nr:glycosyl hydrolase family 18 protein [Chitinophaga tropicalis]MVT08225.1 hypothetical protein [Chitinophaga tropicalis]
MRCFKRSLQSLFIFFILFSLFTTAAGGNILQQQPKPKDTVVKVKLLQRIIAALQFRKNARAREQQRVITIIRSVLADSLIATARDIQQLNEELSLQQNQHFDSLKVLIDEILTNRGTDTLYVSDTTVLPSPGITEKDIISLVNKIIPILQQKEKEDNNAAIMQEKLKQIRLLYGRSPDKIDTLRLNDTTGRRYKLSLGHKAHVIGIHPWWMEDRYLNYNLAALSTFNFHGYTADGGTGKIRDIIPPATLKALPFARQAGCNAMFTLYDQDAQNIDKLLRDEQRQFRYIDSILPLIQQHQADGVNIWFSKLHKHQRTSFNRFVLLLSNYIRHNMEQPCNIMITIPAYDAELAYDLRTLDSIASHFLIDFTTPGRPMAPLKGDAAHAIEPVVSRYLNLQIPPEKFILLLSYNGSKWSTGIKNRFEKLVPYREIRAEFPSDTSVMYDEESVAAFVEEKNETGDVIAEIWFDDASTLDVKYDYILNNGLGGVAIWPLGADDGYAELWDVMAAKFISIDTTFLDTIRLLPPPEIHLSWWDRVKLKLNKEVTTLDYLFTDPCELRNLHYERDRFFMYVTFCFLVLALLAGIFYSYNIRMQGTDWKWRKISLGVLIAFVLLSVLFGGIEMFLNREVPFGLTEHPDSCYTIPLSDLVMVFSAGLVVGILIMYFLVFPLIGDREKP